VIQYNGLTLAYLGDAIYELKIREYLLGQGLTKVHDLHQNAVLFTNSLSLNEVAINQRHINRRTLMFKHIINQRGLKQLLAICI